jgi:multidrug efflux pump subunit AcrB
VEAHIFVAFLAYCLQVALKSSLQNQAPGLSPHAVMEKLATIQMIDVWIPTRDNRWLVLPRYTQPSQEVQIVVLALLILILSPVVILRTPTDINVDISVIAVAFSYTGLDPEDMEGRITTVFERLVTTVTNDVDRATAQITAGSQTVLRFLPPGSQPPVMINYSTSTVPILQLALSGRGLSEQQLNDIGLNFLRTQLITVPGNSTVYLRDVADVRDGFSPHTNIVRQDGHRGTPATASRSASSL